MTSPMPAPQPPSETASAAPPKGAAVGQFRLHKDANLGIPLAKMSKTAFLHQAVFEAAREPSLLGVALGMRSARMPCDMTQRVSITVTPVFNEAVAQLSTLMRISGEEVVRLAVEYAVFGQKEAKTA